MKKKFFFTCFLLIYLSAKTQVAVSYFPFQSLLCVETNTEKLLWLDYKVETNTFAVNSNMELSPKINFKRTEMVNYYAGPGVAFNPVYSLADLNMLTGYFIDFGVRVKPIEKYKSLQFVFEISPMANRQFNNGNFRTRLGVSYNFTRKKKI